MRQDETKVYGLKVQLLFAGRGNERGEGRAVHIDQARAKLSSLTLISTSSDGETF
jgi:hypothetical protein